MSKFDQGSIKGQIQKNNQSIATWAGFLLFSLAIFYFVSDWDFSFIMTFAAFIRTFGLALLVLKMFTSASVKGVSFKTLQLYIFIFAGRLTSIFRHSGYLPYDRSGDWFYHFVEVVSLGLCILAIGLIKGPFKHTYDENHDVFGNFKVPSEVGAIVYLAGPALFLAMIFKPALNADFLSDASWAFSMYLESVAILPQLFMFQKQANGIVENLISHFVFALGFARVLDMVFWLSSYSELTDHSGSTWVGVFVLLTQFIHIVIMIDFFYYYFISIKTGLPFQLPKQAGLV